MRENLFPLSSGTFIEMLRRDAVGPNQCLELKIMPRVDFRGRCDKRCRQTGEGFRRVTPVNISLDALVILTNQTKQQTISQTKCFVPIADVSTRDLLTNIANALAICATTNADSPQVATAIIDKASSNGALGGTGLLRRINSPYGSGSERKTVGAQAQKLFLLLVTELPMCTNQLFNAVLVSPNGLGMYGPRNACKTIVAE